MASLPDRMSVRCLSPCVPPHFVWLAMYNLSPMNEACASGRSESERVETLLQRISDNALAEERQDAVAELRDVLNGNPEVIKSYNMRASLLM